MYWYESFLQLVCVSNEFDLHQLKCNFNFGYFTFNGVFEYLIVYQIRLNNLEINIWDVTLFFVFIEYANKTKTKVIVIPLFSLSRG